MPCTVDDRVTHRHTPEGEGRDPNPDDDEAPARREGPVSGQLIRSGAPRGQTGVRFAVGWFVAKDGNHRSRTHVESSLPLVLDRLLRRAMDVTQADFGNLQVIDPRDGSLRVVAQHGFDRDFLEFFRVVKVDPSACSAALRERRSIVVPNVRTSRHYTESARRVMLKAKALACVSAPCLAPSGAVLGVISTHFTAPHRPTPRQLALLAGVAARVSEALMHQRAQSPRLPADPQLRAIEILERLRDASSAKVRIVRPDTP